MVMKCKKVNNLWAVIVNLNGKEKVVHVVTSRGKAREFIHKYDNDSPKTCKIVQFIRYTENSWLENKLNIYEKS